MGRTADDQWGVGSCQPILNEGTIYARWGTRQSYYLVAMAASSRKLLDA